MLTPEVAETLANFERQLKAIKEQEERIKNTILQEMEAQNIIKIDTPQLTITYVAQTDRETFDVKGFKEENPLIYDAYTKMTPVKSSIRIKTK